MYLQTRVTLRAFPVATPRGHSSSSHGGELQTRELQFTFCFIVLYRLSNFGVTDEGCAALASALRSNPSHLRELNLSRNNLGKSGVKLLSDLKDDSHYKLDTFYYCEYIIISIF